MVHGLRIRPGVLVAEDFLEAAQPVKEKAAVFPLLFCKI